MKLSSICLALVISLVISCQDELNTYYFSDIIEIHSCDEKVYVCVKSNNKFEFISFDSNEVISTKFDFPPRHLIKYQDEILFALESVNDSIAFKNKKGITKFRKKGRVLKKVKNNFIILRSNHNNKLEFEKWPDNDVENIQLDLLDEFTLYQDRSGKEYFEIIIKEKKYYYNLKLQQIENPILKYKFSEYFGIGSKINQYTVVNIFRNPKGKIIYEATDNESNRIFLNQVYDELFKFNGFVKIVPTNKSIYVHCENIKQDFIKVIDF